MPCRQHPCRRVFRPAGTILRQSACIPTLLRHRCCRKGRPLWPYSRPRKAPQTGLAMESQQHPCRPVCCPAGQTAPSQARGGQHYLRGQIQSKELRAEISRTSAKARSSYEHHRPCGKLRRQSLSQSGFLLARAYKTGDRFIGWLKLSQTSHFSPAFRGGHRSNYLRR